MEPTVTIKDTIIPVEERSTIVNNPTIKQETAEEQLLAAINASEGDSTVVAEALTKVGKSLPVMVLCGLFMLIIPVLQLLIGWQYADACPIDPKIPKYLFVAGAVGIASAIISQIRTYLAAKSLLPTVNRAGPKPIIIAATATNSPLNSVITIISTILLLFMIVWFVFGCIWIFGVWNDVQYRPQNHPNFCQALVYRFAYILLIIPIVLIILACCCPLCIACVFVSGGGFFNG
ncbi:unnamed protein product [Adineta steineri]|uniref:Uncharacterized protein n=1 Tax=Adineta steineri TaxID=433720 RepID=A0A815A0T1_9BILA|nr:unnamed protein product [Adineta steineri]